MPTYDYQCRSCGAITEVIHSMLEEGPTVCERCGGELRRILYPAGIIFKGSGLFKTDSRSATSGSVGSTTSTPGGAKGAAGDGAAKPTDTKAGTESKPPAGSD